METDVAPAVTHAPDRQEPATGRRLRWRVPAVPRPGFGALAGLLAGLPLLGTVTGLASRGWAPTGDEAVIAWRSWDVLAGNGPLVGQYTQASGAVTHPVYDPGPLLYWALAIPTHLAPGIGPVVAVTIVGLLSCVAACVAATQVAGRRGAVVVAAALLLVGWSLAGQLGEAPTWNPFAPLIPFAALLVIGWVVAAGRLAWWPAAVLLASFCLQAHLMFALPSLVAALVAPAVGYLIRRRHGPPAGWRWAAAGGVVGLLCWLPAVWQQVTGRNGNLALLWRSTFGTDGPTFGYGAGLRRLGQAVGLPQPSWAHAPRHLHLDDPAAFAWVWAVLALGALATVAVVGWRRRRFGYAAAALVCLLADLGGVWTFASISNRTPEAAATNLYIQHVFWPLGIMTWVVVGAALVALARRRWSALPARVAAIPRLPAAVAVLAVVSVVLTGWQHGRSPAAATLQAGQTRRDTIDLAHRIAALAGRPGPAGGRLGLLLAPGVSDDGVSLVAAATYDLRVRGWTPVVSDLSWQNSVEPVYRARNGDPVLFALDGPAGPPAAGPTGSRPVGTLAMPGGRQITLLRWSIGP